MFISEFENKESLCNVMSEIYKNGDAKKSKFQEDCLNYLRCVVIISNFSYYLLVSLFVSRDSISIILKEKISYLCSNYFHQMRI